MRDIRREDWLFLWAIEIRISDMPANSGAEIVSMIPIRARGTFIDCVFRLLIHSKAIKYSIY